MRRGDVATADRHLVEAEAPGPGFREDVQDPIAIGKTSCRRPRRLLQSTITRGSACSSRHSRSSSRAPRSMLPMA